MRKAALASASAALALGLAGCAVHGEQPASPASAAPGWSYEGTTGPAQWGGLKEEYALCQTGQQGSPIDIRGAIPAHLGHLDVRWQPVDGEVVDTGHGIQVNVSDAGGFVLQGRQYDLVQFHFHTPAEHLVQGRRYPLAAHFVHRRGDGLLGVIGVFIQEGAPNPVLQSVLEALSGQTGAATSLPISNLLPRDRTFFRYAGSLTTPPCSETVDWVVLEQPITASPDQIATLSRLYADNARPVQPHYRRLILKSVS